MIADKQFEYYQKAMKALSVTVRIEHGQVLKVIIEDLIKKRNAPGNLKKDSFDDVLMYYLGKEDFEKYVINGEMIED